MNQLKQAELDLPSASAAGEILKRIRDKSRDESKKGRWFENLFAKVARQLPEWEIV